MTHGPTRRQFLKASAAGGMGLALTAAFGGRAYAGPGRIPATVPQRVAATLATGPATALPSTLPLGKPLADIAKGWDGTLWGADENGVPHGYDALAKKWSVLGNGFDVIALWEDGRYLVTRGSMISVESRDPVPLSTQWPDLPDSFAQGLDGAANVAGTLYLFRQGRYLGVDVATGTVGTPTAVTDLAGWPTSGDAWRNGAVDVVGSNGTTTSDTRVLLWAGGEFVFVDMTTKRVIDGPHPLTWYVKGQMLAGMQQGFRTLLWDESDHYYVQAFNGPIVWTSGNRDGTAIAEYATGYYSPWVPRVSHAPSGNAGALWAPTKGSGFPALFDGTDWQRGDAVPNGEVLSISVGTDGSVFALDQENMLRRNETSGAWDVLARPTGSPAEISVSDASDIWVRDSRNTAYRFEGGSLKPVDLGEPAVAIAAGSDGTLWHCADDTPIYRYLADGSTASTPLDPGAPSGTKITRVGATGFGSAYVLAGDSGAVYEYDTPYVFKTAAAYFTGFNVARLNQSLSIGAHSLFASTYPLDVTPGAAAGQVSAIDVQSGARLWSRFLPADIPGSAGQSVRNVYDPRLGLVYVIAGLAVFALDAVTGQQMWTYDTFDALRYHEGQLGGATLDQGMLYVGYEVGGVVLAIDTDDALARSRAKQDPVALWVTTTWSGSTLTGVGAPVVVAGTVYAMVYAAYGDVPYVVALDGASGKQMWKQTLTAPGQGRGVDELPWDIVVGNTLPTGAGVGAPALFVNAGTALFALDPTTGKALRPPFLPPHPTGTNAPVLTSGLVCRGDRIYAGDDGNKLYVLDAMTLTLVTATSDSAQSDWTGILSRPVVIAGADPSAGAVIGFTRGDDHIYFFDPASGSLDSIRTDQTNPGLLGYDEAHGVLYSMAWARGGDFSSQLGQMFALRPDSYIQDERSFVVESELLQDFGTDAEAAGAGVARYQTHVSIVDSNKAGRGNQAVKLWADEAGTVVRIDGTSFTIGPQAPAVFATDATGSFTVISDATDLTAVTLRMWAAFMDPNERISVVPDAEFHARLAAVSADGSTDPQQMDLVSATSYDGRRLFTDRDQATAAATSITQLTSSVGLGAGVGTTGLRGGLGEDAARYLAYPDQPGVAYSPVDVGIDRSVTGQAATGFSLTPAGHTALSPAAAADLLDGLTGTPTVLLGGTLSSLRAAWQEIKSEAATVEQVVVSAAREVIAGIQYVVNGVRKVIKAVVTDIKDAAAAIGSFFVRLGKDLAKVIQALGKLLGLHAVLETAKTIRSQLDAMFGFLPTLLGTGLSTLDGWLTGAETEIRDDFNALYTAMGLPADGGGAVSATSGMGGTPTTTYNSGNDGRPSQAVECGWSGHVLRTNAGQVTPATTLAATDAGTAPIDVVVTSFGTFLTRLATDPILASAYASAGQSFATTFTATSIEQFLADALKDILESFETIAITGVAVVKALVDAINADLSVVVACLRQTAQVNIPILSALWRKLTGGDLSYLDLISFVLAFPVTIMAATFDRTSSLQASSTDATATTSSGATATNVLALAAGLGMMGAGVITALLDSTAAANVTRIDPAKPGAPILVIGLVLQLFAISSSLYSAQASGSKYAAVAALTGINSTLLMTIPPTPENRSFLSFLNMLLALVNIAVYSVKAHEKDDPALTVTREVLAQVPVFVNPIKLQGPPWGFISPAADLVFRGAAGTIQITQTALAWYAADTAPPPPTPPPSTPPSAPTSTTTGSTSTRPVTTAPSTGTATGPSSSSGGTRPGLADTGVGVSGLLTLGLGTLAAGGAAVALTRSRGEHEVQ